MIVKMYILGILCLIASTLALPYISDSPNIIRSVQNFEIDKNKPGNVVALKENKEKGNDKYKEKDVDKSVSQGFLNSFVESSNGKDYKEEKKNKVDKYDDRFPKESKEKQENYIDKEKGKDKKEKVEEKSDFQAFFDSFAENGKVKDSKNKKDKEVYKYDNKFIEKIKEKKEDYKDKENGKYKEKDDEKSDFQVFLGFFADNFKTKDSKKEKNKQRDKYNNLLDPEENEPVYSYYLIDVNYKEDKIKVYPDTMFNNYAIGRKVEPFYDYLNYIDYLTSPYYPPRPFYPFPYRPKYRRPNVVHRKWSFA